MQYFSGVIHTSERNFARDKMQAGDKLDLQAIWRDWLVKTMSAVRMKPTPFAKEAGVAPSTIIRALDADAPGKVSIYTIEKIADHYGVALPPMPPPSTSGRQNGRPAGFSEPELTQIHHDARDAAGFQPSAREGLWEIRSRALELDGYVPGDLVLVEIGLSPRAGDIVCAQVYDTAGGAETVLRRYDPPYLVTATADPAAPRKPLLVDGDRVVIMGTVIRSMRSRSS